MDMDFAYLNKEKCIVDSMYNGGLFLLLVSLGLYFIVNS